MSENLA
jgi:hypothetical protein